MDRNAAEELAADIAGYLDDERLLVTIDYAAASSAVSNGGSVIYIPAPTLEFPTHFAADATYRPVIVTCSDDPLIVWQDALELALPIVKHEGATELEPAAFQPAQGPLLPAFSLTLTRSYDL